MARRKRFGFVVNTTLPDFNKAKKLLGADRDGDVQKFVTDDVFKRLIPYIPKRSGELRSNAKIVSNTKIEVTGIYARAQFFGVTRSGKPFDYNELAGAKVGAHWDRRLIADEGGAIVADANRYIKGRK